MKSLWKRLMTWITSLRSNHQTAERSGMDNHYRLDTLYTLDAREEVIDLKRDKMQDFIEQKKNRKPFYKDDNKKDWE